MDEERKSLSITPPRYSLVKSINTIKDKGIINALEDTEQGPHVHLTLLLVTVVIVSIGIIILSRII
jgi:hypothetical protein